VADFDAAYFDARYGGDYERRNPVRKLRYYLDAVRDLRPSGRLLDVGCAYGLFLAEARKHYEVTGADVSQHAVERARALLPGTQIIQAGIEDLSPGERFDVITCFDVLEHVADLDNAFAKLTGLLREDGVLALTVPVYDSPAGVLVGLLDRDETHLWKKNRDFWRTMMTTKGFSLVRDEGLWRYALGKYYLFWGGRRWRNLSPAILLIGARS